LLEQAATYVWLGFPIVVQRAAELASPLAPARQLGVLGVVRLAGQHLLELAVHDAWNTTSAVLAADHSLHQPGFSRLAFSTPAHRARWRERLFLIPRAESRHQASVAASTKFRGVVAGLGLLGVTALSGTAFAQASSMCTFVNNRMVDAIPLVGQKKQTQET